MDDGEHGGGGDEGGGAVCQLERLLGLPPGEQRRWLLEHPHACPDLLRAAAVVHAALPVGTAATTATTVPATPAVAASVDAPAAAAAVAWVARARCLEELLDALDAACFPSRRSAAAASASAASLPLSLPPAVLLLWSVVQQPACVASLLRLLERTPLEGVRWRALRLLCRVAVTPTVAALLPDALRAAVAAAAAAGQSQLEPALAAAPVVAPWDEQQWQQHSRALLDVSFDMAVWLCCLQPHDSPLPPPPAHVPCDLLSAAEHAAAAAALDRSDGNSSTGGSSSSGAGGGCGGPGCLTIATDMVPLSAAAAAALQHVGAALEAVYFRALQRTGGASACDARCDWLATALQATAHAQREASATALAALASALDERVRRHGARGAFVKLSCRSPKDALVLRRRAASGLCVRSGAEAVELLLASRRVRDDLAAYARVGACPTVAVRPWCRIPAWSEVRGFVSGGRLTALSQYATVAPWPELRVHGAALAERVRALCEELVVPRLPYAHAVVDFALCDDDGEGGDANEAARACELSAADAADATDAAAATAPTAAATAAAVAKAGVDMARLRVVVLELNPFAPATSAGLFSWSTDLPQLCTGPFEFRMLR